MTFIRNVKKANQIHLNVVSRVISRNRTRRVVAMSLDIVSKAVKTAIHMLLDVGSHFRPPNTFVPKLTKQGLCIEVFQSMSLRNQLHAFFRKGYMFASFLSSKLQRLCR